MEAIHDSELEEVAVAVVALVVAEVEVVLAVDAVDDFLVVSFAVLAEMEEE